MQFDASDLGSGFPRQNLPYTQKGKKWRCQCVNWGAERNVVDYSPVRRSVQHKQINYDLLNGKLHLGDMKLILNPFNIQGGFTPENIQHYPIMNTKLQVLRGEESSRVFDYTITITNPDTLSQIEEERKNWLLQKLMLLLADSSVSEEDFQNRIVKLQKYYRYSYKDIREIRANAVVDHYFREYNVPILWNNGFMDACAVGEEIYQLCIVRGEPIAIKLNPRKVRVYRSGFSNKIEDADMVVIEDYWSKGRIFDTFDLTPEDAKYIEDLDTQYERDGTAENYYEPNAFLRIDNADSDILTASDLFASRTKLNDLPYDFEGNVRVCQVFWKSRRKVKKVTSFNPVTGEEEFNIYPETYIPNKDMGEKVEELWINEAWQGTKIGERVYVDVGPCPIQYNRLNNPSKCHFGIIGSIYNLNDDKPFSLVDIMKAYNYLYDAVFDKLNKLIARNHGKIIRLDLAKIPAKWNMDKWITILATAGIAVENSFAEGQEGAAKGKLAAMFNNANSGVIDAELSSSIVSEIQLLEFIKNEMAEVAGISKQREGQIQNRETVGGVERATLQSSHITEWIFFIHEDIKKRFTECFLETAKVAFKGKNKKIPYILSDASKTLMEIPGDEFAECDYGLVVDNSKDTQEFKQNLPNLVSIGIQSQTITLGIAMQIYNAKSMAEKRRIIEEAEEAMREAAEQQRQAQLQNEQQIAQMQQQVEMQKLELQDQMNRRDNETKLLIATLQAKNGQALEKPNNDNMEQAKLDEKKREFDQTLLLDKQKLALDEKKEKNATRLKEQQINKQSGK